eukprot:4484811-Prymnesium_polylepis.1
MAHCRDAEVRLEKRLRRSCEIVLRRIAGTLCPGGTVECSQTPASPVAARLLPAPVSCLDLHAATSRSTRLAPAGLYTPLAQRSLPELR